MNKRTAATLAFVVALTASAWPLVVERMAPFGTGLPMFALWIVGGAASFAAVVFAARQPRQLGLLAAASVVAVSHVAIWSWIAVIAITGGP
jgi:hypothetical protein